jgi:nucleoid DNA-binding protein
LAYSTAYKKIDNILNIWSHKLLNSDLSISSLGSFKINIKIVELEETLKQKKNLRLNLEKVVSFKKSKN